MKQATTTKKKKKKKEKNKRQRNGKKVKLFFRIFFNFSNYAIAVNNNMLA